VVDGDPYDAVLLTPESVAAWSPPPLAELAISDLAPLLALEPRPEFLLLGSGKSLARPPRALADQLHDLGSASKPWTAAPPPAPGPSCVPKNAGSSQP
jgi:uncharacterized protein